MQHKNSEKGQAIVLLVLLIVGLLAIAGLAIDGGRVYSARRNAQNAADNAALAAALALCSGTNVNTAALGAAAVNSFNNDGSTNTVAVNRPPQDGPNEGDDDYIEVIIDSSEAGTISQLVFKGELAYSARAVGHCTDSSTPPGGGFALIVLHADGGPSYASPYDRYPLKSKPGGLIDVEGSIFVNSGSPDAYSSYGHVCGMAAIYGVHSNSGAVVGGPYEDCAGYLAPDPSTGVAPMGDPLASLAGPSNPGSCASVVYDNSDIATMNPGCYTSITVEDNAIVTMNPGTYYITGDNLRVRNSGRLTANNVLLYFTGQSSTEGVLLEDDAIVVMSAPVSGVYKGMVVFMDNGGGAFYVHDDAFLTLTGTLYAPDAFLQVYGMTSGHHAFMTANGSQIIVDTAWVGSTSSCTNQSSCPSTSGTLTLVYDANLIYGAAGSALIELSE